MLQSYLLAATAILTLSQHTTTTFGYSPANLPNRPAQPASTADAAATRQTSRRQLLSQLVATTSSTIAAVATVAVLSEPASAAAAAESIEKCATASKSACVSTANVKNLDLYVPPWTFDESRYSQAEVMSRLKGAIVSDASCQILTQDENTYLQVEAKRNDIFDSIDELEFVVNDQDHVVFFRSRATNNENTDFGINKKRLEDIRKRAGIFGVMGESMNTADSVSTSERGNGPLGQLKAFYGLQSGGGFEDVLRE